MSYENIYNDIISFDSLYKAMRKVKNGVMWKDSTARYVADGLKETYRLRQELLAGTYQIRPYLQFTVTDPKRREVMATQLRDRQFQRALCDGGLYGDLTEHFIRDNYACQVGRGMDDAINRLTEQLRRYYRQHGTDGWVLKCDIKSYFASTPHDIAKRAIRKRVQDPDVCRAVEQIIDSFPGDRGIGLGSQVSQLIELCVLDDLDHFIRERLHIHVYARYMDDFVLVHPDKEYLAWCREQIRKRLDASDLTLNKKTSLFPLSQGITFLQRRFIVTETGKVIAKISGTSITREKRKLRHMRNLVAEGRLPLETPCHSFISWAAGVERKRAKKNNQKRRLGKVVLKGPNAQAVENMREYFRTLFGFDPYQGPRRSQNEQSADHRGALPGGGDPGQDHQPGSGPPPGGGGAGRSPGGGDRGVGTGLHPHPGRG